MAATTAPEVEETPTDDGGGRSFWSHPRTVLSLVLVGALVAAAAWLVLDDPAGTPEVPPAAGAPAQGGDGEQCGPAGGSQTPPADTPTADWQLVGSMAAPTLDSVGPAATDGVPACWSPDPLGALFMAATFVASTSDPDLRFEAVKDVAVRNAGRTAALADIALRGPGGDTTGVQLAGFAFQSYRPAESAVIDLVLTSQGALVHLAIEVAWDSNDWHVVLPPTGGVFDGLQPLPSMAGYIPLQGA